MTAMADTRWCAHYPVLLFIVLFVPVSTQVFHEGQQNQDLLRGGEDYDLIHGQAPDLGFDSQTSEKRKRGAGHFTKSSSSQSHGYSFHHGGMESVLPAAIHKLDTRHSSDFSDFSKYMETFNPVNEHFSVPGREDQSEDTQPGMQADRKKPFKSGIYNLGFGHGQGHAHGHYNTRYGLDAKHFSSGTCETRLSAPMNSALKCSTYSGCQASCLRDYAFPNGETQIFFVCDNGQWRVKGSTNDTIPQCYPICIPPCQHGGNCVSPNTCDCPENFSGPYCQYERKRCIGFPPTPNNSKKICNSESCTIACLDKHQFPDGSGIANIFCKNGEWTPGRPDWTTIPDCKPVCTPACQNGGSCLGYNTCNCPQQFRGSQCQYSVDVCDARKLNFNGNYNCTEIGGTYSCMVSCPMGMTFQTRPSEVYSCDYSEGVYHPSSVPQCVFSGDTNHGMEFIFSPGMSESEIKKKSKTIRKYKTSDLSLGYSDLINSVFVLEEKTPTPGVCFTWAGSHYKTFDGRIISFKSNCLYTLASDAVDNTFHIQSQTDSCDTSNCKQRINVYINEKEYQLAVNSEGFPIVVSGKEQLSIPNQLPGLRLEIGGHAVIATLQNLGVSVRWNLEDMVEVRVSESMWNHTGGLCGQIDGHASNDLESVHDSVTAFASKWQVNTVSDTCSDNVEEDHKCFDAASQQAAHEFCNRLMTAPVFDACRKILPTREYYEACKWDYCACNEVDKSSCACDSLAMFVRDCVQKGEKSAANWRDESTCPVTCNGGRVYKACGPTTESTCASPDISLDTNDKCEEGCYCPHGTRLLGNKCVDPEECPCQLRGRLFQPGQKVPKDCNTCECINGQWVCTTLQCDAKCEGIGDPHYMTFDGKRFDFMGKCSYYLLQSDGYSVEAENIACEGRISENMGYSVAMMSVTPSCTKAVTVRLGDDKVLRLKQGKEITFNGEDIDKLPLSLGDAYVRAASSVFIQVELSDGVEILWDGQTRVYINAPASLKGKTKGLCGTFNGNQKDDFLTPEGDVEQDVYAFANKWKTKEKCDNADEQKAVGHPCEVNIQNKAAAEAYCSNLTSSLFADCHFFVDPTPYYQDCLYDMCSCNGKTSDCLCPILGSYGKECSHQGAMVDWRNKVKICGIHCPSGMQYQVCGNSCTRSCDDLTRYKQCSKTSECVEGCFCPTGRTMDSHGECVPIATCSCMQNGMEYPAGHKEIRPGSKALQLCTCKNAQWNCENATPDQIKEYPNHSLHSPGGCSATRHQEFTHCEPPEPVTCKNMHDRPRYTPAICRSGCICKRGYVLDSLTKECVRPKDCPCHHGGRSYSDGHKIQEDCNTCTCESGKWKCTERACPGVCSAWGDSHFRTFDGRIYDFQGACDYMLTKGAIGDSDSFNVALEIVPCGSTGASCPKAVTLSVGSKHKHETVTFSTTKPIPSAVGLERITIREAGLFVFAEVFDLGVVLQWDKGTRVMVKADPKWKGRLRGLCGNYNNDEKDDFQTPSGGVSEVSAQLFGDSWKLQPYCPESAPVEDTCKLHPTRKSWAVQKCGILKSALFKPCHSEVPIDAYLERCIFDTCACDQGGDCECLCAAIAAYAQECNAHGVHIKWRSQQLCPMQCDETCAEYSPCVQTCPQETCDNILIHKSLMKLCEQDTCVEGCQLKPCPPGQVYKNLTDLQCVPVATCKPVCLKVGDKEYYEGDLMEGDDCYRCVCSRHKKTCTGQPCTSPPPMVTSALTPEDQGLTCSPGWTEWMSNDQPIPDKKDTDIEPLPTTKDFSYFVKEATENNKLVPTARCSSDMMVDIECRTVGSHRNYKDLFQNVECSLENGLVCTGGCDNYEIRVLCHCGTTVKTTPSATTTTTQTTTTQQITTTGVPVTVRPTTTTESEVEILRCDVLRPMTQHETDCARYYQCIETEFGLEQMERECAPSLWFNPETMTCDWPAVVKDIRPECIEAVTEPGCTDTWTDWLNVTHPNKDGGDFELIKNIEKEGIQICSNNGYIKDVVCKFYKFTHGKFTPWEAAKKAGKGRKRGGRGKWELSDYEVSGDIVSCTAEEGLRCMNEDQSDNMCEDYAVKFLCACEKKSEDIKVEKPIGEKPNRTEEVVTGAECKDMWSPWFNVTHPTVNSADFELIENMLGHGIEICPNNRSVKDAECKFYNFTPNKSTPWKGTKTGWKGHRGGKWELADYSLSGEVVTCSPEEGLRCLNEEQSDNLCEDYAVRFLCSCEKKAEGIEHEKPKEEKPTNQTEGHGCRADEVWSDCNIRCDQLCLFYDHILVAEGKCKGINRCVPGCWPADKIDSCPPGFMWREFGSCVRIDDCTCRSHKGEIVKPGTVVYESDCEICQCLNNHYTCDSTACATSTTEASSTTLRSMAILPVHRERTTTTTAATTTTTTTTTAPLTTAGVFIVPSTVTPPPRCDREQFIPLTADLPDSAFTASSSIDGPGFRPQDARLTPDSLGSWKPIHMNEEQYLQIDLGQVEAVYGVISRGSPEANEFVNSFYVLYSTDNQTFSYVTFMTMPEIFRGALTNYEPMVQVFAEPVEAQYIRVNPKSWTNGIAMNVEVLGCRIETTTEMFTTEATTTTTHSTKATTTEATTTTTTTPEVIILSTLLPTMVPPVCTDEMGLDNGAMNDEQVTVSSSMIDNFHGKEASFSSPKGWTPLTNSPNEWIQFDFLDERTLTGIKTKGSQLVGLTDIPEEFWVKAYKITYSHDGKAWNPILTNGAKEKVFMGNFDGVTPHTNYFDKPIHARYLRIYPTQWDSMISLKVEVLGCYSPYPEITTPAVTTQESVHTTPAEQCNVCHGVPEIFPCPCSTDTWWDGEQCTVRTQCPCYVGHIPYAVGSVYDTEDCEQCICSLGGTPQCAQKICPTCDQGFQGVLTATCGCVCKPCPESTVLCPTTNVCVNSTSWCDGVVDCPDDEINCTTTPVPTTVTTSPSTPTSTEAIASTPLPTSTVGPEACPPVECPEGFKVNFKKSSNLELQEEELSPHWSPFGTKRKQTSIFGFKRGGVKGGRKGGREGGGSSEFDRYWHKYAQKQPKPMKIIQKTKICPEYECVPVKKEKFCPMPKCSDGYELKTVVTKKEECPRYSCDLKQIPNGKCNVTGRTFDTFDGTEYKYDICDHILAQDKIYKQWQIKLKKSCKYIGSCSRSLTITQHNHTIQLNSDLSILYDGYSYTVPQMQKISSQTHQFAMKKVSDKFIIFASTLDFSVIWDSQGNARIVVPGTSRGQVNGLCGFFDGKIENDKQKPDGGLARTSVEFGDSWGKTDCETKVCPIHIQNKAWEMCNTVKKEPLKRCEDAVNLEKFISHCVETVCTCMEANVNSTEECKCQALLEIVTLCQANKPDVDLSTWRMVHDCPVECPPPLVYKECYDRVCEPSCAELVEEDPCPVSESTCFPGCYCPGGLVRDGEHCVRPTECRDCVCDGFGKSRFITFDKVDYTFNGNCTYVLSKTIESTSGPKFKVLVSNGPCEDSVEETCVKSVTLVYEDHTVVLGSVGNNDKMSVLVDGMNVGLPMESTWCRIVQSPNKGINLAVPKLQMDLLFHGIDQGFSLRLPSHLYRGRTEGLCGSCNANQTDDVKTSTNEITEDTDKFGKSWRATDLPVVLGTEELCSITPPKNECALLPPNEDPCLKLLDEDLFGKCHAVVDPVPFLSACHESWCEERKTNCRELESYARECENSGVCLDWRSESLCPYTCPPGRLYKACGLGCEITCDNHELLDVDPEACTKPRTDACVCPPGEVLKNGTCVLAVRCQPCDAEGHYPGDVWNPDTCTKCTCENVNNVQCQRIQCPTLSTVCQRGHKSIIVKGTESDCCPKYICVPEPKEEKKCPPLQQQPVCGFGQIMKTEITEDGCQEFICQCLPLEECPDTSTEMASAAEQPGMIAIVNRSGCCPRVDVVCKPETCPMPPTCREPFYEPVARDVERCCPQYRCEPPKDKCLYEFEFIHDDKGGERKRLPSEKYTDAKKGGETWQDGPCHSCYCKEPEYRAVCTKRLCQKPPVEVDYVITAQAKPKECCPVYRRTACKVGDMVYEEGDIWPSPDGDRCKNISCVRGPDGELTQQESVQTCNRECPVGWRYVEPLIFSPHCCGECEPYACVVNGVVHAQNSVWHSADNCTSFTCDISSKQVQVISTQEQCPNVDDCAPDRLYKEGCCTKCNITTQAQSICSPEALPANETVKLVRTVLTTHGICENYDAIPNFTECRGICDSYTFYNQKTGVHDSKCLCCQAVGFSNVLVKLQCEDGFVLEKKVPVPSTCSCEACIEEVRKPLNVKTRPSRYTKS